MFFRAHHCAAHLHDPSHRCVGLSTCTPSGIRCRSHRYAILCGAALQLLCPCARLTTAAPTLHTQLLLAPRRTRVALSPDATGALLRRNAELLLHWLCGKVRSRVACVLAMATPAALYNGCPAAGGSVVWISTSQVAIPWQHACLPLSA